METVMHAKAPRAIEQPSRRWQAANALAPAAILIGYAIVLAGMAFALDSDDVDKRIARTWLTGASILAGFAYLAMLLPLTRRPRSLRPWWILSVALTARLIVAVSPPMHDSDSQDYHRYLWDGAVVAHRLNPYCFTPAEILTGAVTGPQASRFDALARDGRETLSRINHPNVTTIYPPLAQVGFAMAYLVDPFGFTGLRLMLFLADALTIVMLLRVLKILRLPGAHIAWFAWNPLLLREVYSSLHMDMLALPVISGAVLAGLRGRHTLGAILCVAGSAIKIWPILLAPLFLRAQWARWRSLAMTVIVCGAILVLLWAPVLAAPHTESSGFVAYANSWQNNDGFFRCGIWLTEQVLGVMRIERWRSQEIMRTISVMLVIVVMLWQLGRPPNPGDLPSRCLIIVGAVFLLSPTQFPWYWLWCLPLLTIRPFLPLLLYTALLPLYYVQDWWGGIQAPPVYWIEHAPVWGLLAWEVVRTRRSRRSRRGDRVDDVEVAHA